MQLNVGAKVRVNRPIGGFVRGDIFTLVEPVAEGIWATDLHRYGTRYDFNEAWWGDGSSIELLPAIQKENDMFTTIDDEEKKMETLSNIGRQAAVGIKFGVGMAVSRTATKGVAGALEKAGAPKELIQHPLMQMLLQLGAPALLQAVGAVTPGLKDSEKIGSFLSFAQQAAFANVTAETLNAGVDYAAPIFGELLEAAKMAGQLGEMTVEQVDP